MWIFNIAFLIDSMYYTYPWNKCEYIECGVLKTQEQLFELCCFLRRIFERSLQDSVDLLWECVKESAVSGTMPATSEQNTCVGTKAEGLISTGDAGGGTCPSHCYCFRLISLPKSLWTLSSYCPKICSTWTLVKNKMLKYGAFCSYICSKHLSESFKYL